MLRTRTHIAISEYITHYVQYITQSIFSIIAWISFWLFSYVFKEQSNGTASMLVAVGCA